MISPKAAEAKYECQTYLHGSSSLRDRLGERETRRDKDASSYAGDKATVYTRSLHSIDDYSAVTYLLHTGRDTHSSIT